MTTITNCIVTFYTASRLVLCADGNHPVAGLTVAAPRWVPLGTMVEISGHNYRVMDRTARRFDGRWDVFVSTKAEAVKRGKVRRTVTWDGPQDVPEPSGLVLIAIGVGLLVLAALKVRADGRNKNP